MCGIRSGSSKIDLDVVNEMILIISFLPQLNYLDLKKYPVLDE